MYSRLDYILINYALVGCVQKIEHLPSFKSDHSPVCITLDLNKDAKRGPGFWKLNESILESKSNLDQINTEVEKILQIATIEKYEKCYKWERVKETLVCQCKLISKERAKKMNENFVNIQTRIEKLSKEQNSGKMRTNLETEQLNEEIEQSKVELSTYLEYKARGARIRSRSKWYDSGELPTKYFLGLEKTKYQNKTLRAVMCEDKTITRDQHRIITEQAKFYKKLYSKNPEAKFTFINTTDAGHTNEDKESLDKPFTYEEFTAALKSMASGKCPGIDGLTKAIYVVMWSRIGPTLWDAVLQSHQDGVLYRSVRRGILSLIPKRKKDPLLIKSWRPLMLLSTDHKIVTKMMTNRLKQFIHRAISTSQSGYVPGRYIGVNIRKLIDTLQYLESCEIPAVLFIIDYEKCFDSVSHESLIVALRYLNVGEYFISWIKMIYNQFCFCVTNNGWSLKFIAQERGVHQGSALSGPLFLYIAEILAINIKKNNDILGISLNAQTDPEKIEQYADDTTLWSLYNE